MKCVFTSSILVFHFSFLSLVCTAQKGGTSQLTSDTGISKIVRVPAGPQFKASGWKKFWWGKHWRKEWLQPVNFPTFDIDTTVGGLTPTKMGGGHQTKSLRMLNKDGREYILRTIDKDLELLIPQELKGSFINDVVNDQICTAHPYGPLAISSLTASIGSLHTNPAIVFVEDNPKFGEYRKFFANKLCLFEERPSGDGWAGTALSNYADDIVNTEKLYSKLEDDNDRYVDQHAFLKIRFLDMLVNDWDRHPDQWAWAAHKENGKTRYVPFARDRDQAFSSTDGVYLYFISRPWVLRSVRDFTAHTKDIAGVNLAAVSLDQQLTNQLTKEQWLSVIHEVQQSLTDSVIHRAIMQMPKEITDMSGAYVEKRLRQRRDDMERYGMKYYKIINKKVTVLGSNKDELFVINKIDKDKTEITITNLNKKHSAGDTLFHRIFTHDLTKEIYLYGYGNNDQFVYTGNAKNSILVRTFGGDGKDEFIDSSVANGSGKKTRIYDTKDNPVSLKNIFKTKATNDTTYTTFIRRAFKYDWYKPVILPGFNPDDGFSLGLGFIYRKQGFHKRPYAWEQSFIANFATETGSLGFTYKGLFKHVIGKCDIELAAKYNAPKYALNYYGFGNETKLGNNNKRFFTVRSAGFSVNPAISRSWKNSVFKFGPVFQSVRIEANKNKFISQQDEVDPSVFTTKYFGGANVSYTIGGLLNKREDGPGILFHIGAGYFANLKETARDYVNFDGSFKFHLKLAKGFILAHRTGFATNTGDYEFYQANTIGGSDYLRGYWRSRFTGETSFYQNTELRLRLAHLRGYILRGDLGLFGFFDDGRVWVKHEDSNKFHNGYGGGIYFKPFNMLALSFTYGVSAEKKLFAIKAGFFF